MYVSIGALVLLILVLTLVGVALTQLQSLDSFPPTQNACPDFWDVSSNPAYCGVPVDPNTKNFGYIDIQNKNVNKENKQNIGMCNSDTPSFGCTRNGQNTILQLDSAPNDKFQYIKLNNNNEWGRLYPGMSEKCAQRSWAQTMNISWDGVTNYNGC
jgi:hypothetical protein